MHEQWALEMVKFSRVLYATVLLCRGRDQECGSEGKEEEAILYYRSTSHWGFYHGLGRVVGGGGGVTRD